MKLQLLLSVDAQGFMSGKMIFLELFILISFAVCGDVVGSDSQSVIGQSFYIPGIDLNAEELHGGFQVFTQIDDCIGEKPFQLTKRSSSFFKDTESFYSSISSETSISVNFKSHYTMGITLDSTTKDISGSSRNVTGMTYMDISLTKRFSLQNRCLINPDLDGDLLSRFERLPSSISEPWSPSGWSAYQIFLNRYGSHVVRMVYSGTALYQHSFSDSSHSHSESVFKTKICAEIGGPLGLNNANACTNITAEDRLKVSSMSVSYKFVARGGSTETRAGLSLERSDSAIKKLLLESEPFAAPVIYKYIPIWDILKEKYFGTEHQVKVHNLQSYYSGFRNYECTHVKKYEPKLQEEYEYQKFEVLDRNDAVGNPIFQCSILNEGCQTVDDCDWSYYKGRVWDWRCYCIDDHCIQYNETDLNTGVTKTTPYLYPSGWDDGLEGNCYAIDDEPYCKCTTSTKRHVLWSSLNNVLFDALTSGNETTSGCSGFRPTLFTVSLIYSLLLCHLIFNFTYP